MGSPLKDTNTDQLMTVEAFAQRYRVDVSVVRHWAKMGYINYELMGTRKLRRIRPDTLIRPIVPAAPAARAVRLLMYRDGMDAGTAQSVVDSMEPADIEALANEEE